MESNIYYVNFDKSASTTDLQTPNHKSDEGKAQKSRGSVCLVLMTVCLGIICVLLLVDSSIGILQYIMSRDQLKSYKNTVEEFSQTINSLQNNYTDLKTEKDYLNKKKLELESKVTSLSDELKKTYEKGYQWGSSWFFISNEYKSWSESRQFCRDRGADLVIINTEEKQRFITSFINARVWPGGVWIGLTDIDQEGKMKWVDNSPLKQGFWAAGEPHNQYGSEDCVELIPTFPVLNWRAIDCSSMRKVICER